MRVDAPGARVRRGLIYRRTSGAERERELIAQHVASGLSPQPLIDHLRATGIGHALLCGGSLALSQQVADGVARLAGSSS